MRMVTRFRRWLMQRPGDTVDLAPMEARLPAIEAMEAELEELSEAELTSRAVERDAGDVVALCALGREAARRGVDLRPYDVQLLGVQALLEGRVIEMATGEGKTLTAAIAACGLAVHGPVHVLTVNDYLARRDAEWMGPLYERMGVSVGWVTESSTADERRKAYDMDVTYASVSEAGFDFLRDARCVDAGERVQRELTTVIVDEADSILIDEARVPLVLAGSTPDGDGVPTMVAELVRELRPDLDYAIDAEGRTAHLTARGLKTVERKLGNIDLYAAEHLDLLTSVHVAVHAEALVQRDVDYIVRNGKVELVDEFRGRVAQRRRWPDGLQAAVEAKEGLTGTGTGEILGTITVQAFIRQYENACGMTGTAVPVGEQLREFYELEVAVIPSYKPLIRKDQPDRVYNTEHRRLAALRAEIATVHKTGRPVLIGTLDVAQSERLAEALREDGIDCNVLNAKNDTEEAAIIAEAGAFGAVTVSTQMTGRGVDIRLGGSDQKDYDRVAELGGLYVIGAGRHDSSRVDNQLRGRAGRQGDPGESRFFVSLDDELVTRYGPDRLPAAAKTKGGLIDDPSIGPIIASAQKIAEQVNLEIHRTTWKYNLVLEQQRQVISGRRDEILSTDDSKVLLEADSDELKEIARQILLFHLDASWTDHLARIADLREGVHLRSLGRENPLDEFHREAIPAFRELTAEISERATEAFAEVEDPEEWDAEEAGLVRPSATWTYMINDNPFGSEMERFIAGVVSQLRGKRTRVR